MVTRRLIRLLTASAMAVLVLPLARAQDRHKPDARNTQRQQPSLVDFALTGVNSSDRNYGQCFDEARRLLIQETVDRAYFWSNLFSITVAGFLFVVVLYQRQCQRRSEELASGAIAQYHNALERAETQIKEATTRNYALMKALSTSMANIADNTLLPPEPVPPRRPIGRPPREESAAKATSPSKPAQPGHDASLTPTQPNATEPVQPVKSASTQSKAAEPAQAANVAAAPATNPSTPSRTVKAVHEEKSKAVDQMGLFGGDVELINKINVLQQQLSSSQEREKHLRRQLNDSELRFQKEQERARTLQS
jgi:hypothetical protein